jgi:hypothetical protein
MLLDKRAELKKGILERKNITVKSWKQKLKSSPGLKIKLPYFAKYISL